MVGDAVGGGTAIDVDVNGDAPGSKDSVESIVS